MTKKIMIVCVALVGLATWLSTTTIRRTEAECVGPDFVAWDHNSSYPDVVRAYNSGGNFSSNQRLEWCFDNLPTNGVVELGSTDPSNVQLLGDEYFSPAYFFPETAIGSIVITWSGDLVNNSANGTLTALGWCWYGGNPNIYREDEKTLTIKCYSTSSCP